MWNAGKCRKTKVLRIQNEEDTSVEVSKRRMVRRYRQLGSMLTIEWTNKQEILGRIAKMEFGAQRRHETCVAE